MIIASIVAVFVFFCFKELIMVTNTLCWSHCNSSPSVPHWSWWAGSNNNNDNNNDNNNKTLVLGDMCFINCDTWTASMNECTTSARVDTDKQKKGSSSGGVGRLHLWPRYDKMSTYIVFCWCCCCCSITMSISSVIKYQRIICLNFYIIFGIYFVLPRTGSARKG